MDFCETINIRNAEAFSKKKNFFLMPSAHEFVRIQKDFYHIQKFHLIVGQIQT